MCNFQKTKQPTVIVEEEEPKSIDGIHPVKSGQERPSPGFWINNGITVSANNVVISGKYTRVDIADTNSMDGTFDIGHTLIVKRPPELNIDDVVRGDIMIYQTPYELVVHSVSDITWDDEGRYFTCWGLNNATPDGDKVRDNNIWGIVVAIVYGS